MRKGLNAQPRHSQRHGERHGARQGARHTNQIRIISRIYSSRPRTLRTHTYTHTRVDAIARNTAVSAPRLRRSATTPHNTRRPCLPARSRLKIIIRKPDGRASDKIRLYVAKMCANVWKFRRKVLSLPPNSKPKRYGTSKSNYETERPLHGDRQTRICARAEDLETKTRTHPGASWKNVELFALDNHARRIREEHYLANGVSNVCKTLPRTTKGGRE